MLWDHLIYAYMIENTRILDIFRRVVYEFAQGERLGTPSVETLHWLRNTEELFYRDAPSFFVYGTAQSRSARQRSDAACRVSAVARDGFESRDLRQQAIPVRQRRGREQGVRQRHSRNCCVRCGSASSTRRNTSGTKATDDAKLPELAKKLEEMLLARRLNGNLSREEFASVAMMSWFHLTLEDDSPVIVDLRAQATSPEQRLYKIAQLVGVPAHGLSGSYFDIADGISRLLLLIETGVFTAVPHAVAALYTPSSVLEPRHAHDHHALVDHHRTRHEGRQGCAARDCAPLGLGQRGDVAP